MRSIALAPAALVLLALPAFAQGGWRNLNGQKVPDITAEDWFNTGNNTPTTANLRGKVYLVEFFATW
ncbi:MAG: hypothetical protein O7E54_06540 [Planctomycetota bacterium]|nr:hypothetical protein [Planctomycetota bacterium]